LQINSTIHHIASDLAFLVAGKLAFEVPLGLVHNSSISKTEVAVEFLDQTNQPKLDGLSGISRMNAKKSTTDQLVEMRLYVPGNASTNANEGNSEADDPGDGEVSAAQALHDLIMEKAEIGRVQGEGIVTFPEVLCTTPRGRYDVDMHADFLRLRGKTYDYKVLYSGIQKLFLLPKPDDIHFLFVVSS
jgi:structure-specific recognition protein 1